MPLQHRFINELNDLENYKRFCGRAISRQNKFLIIGTFNPDDNSCAEPNDATWFYGRQKNWFWKYLPSCLTGQSLHQTSGFNETHWRQYCIDNKIIIVDLLKGIDHPQQLEDYKDKRLDNRINDQLTNASIFNFATAFNNVTFEKVIYTRKGWNPATDRDILKLIQIKCLVNHALLQNNIITDLRQIKYCPAPWQRRPTTQTQWYTALNE